MSQINQSIMDTTIISSNNEITDEEIQEYLSNPQGHERKGTDMTHFSATSFDDDEIFESTITKRIVVYNFWYASCAPCIEETPMLNALQKKYKDKADFIAVTFESRERIDEFLKNHPFTFKHVYMDRTNIDLLELTMGYPTTLIVCDNKIVYYKYGGPSDKSSPYYEPMLKGMYKKYSEIIEASLKSFE